MHQSPARTSVTVVKGVYRLELRVYESRLYERRKCVVVDRSAQIDDERIDLFLRRRDEVRAAGIVVIATNPVLACARSSRGSAFASARASSRTPSCIPSTLDDAMDSVRRSPRPQRRAALVVQLPERLPASETSPESRESSCRLIDESASGMNTS
jgi:hypothetical protein